MSFQKEEDDENETNNGGSFVFAVGAAAVAFGIGIGAGLSYIFGRRTESPQCNVSSDSRSSNSAHNLRNRKWTCKQCSICFDDLPDVIVLPCGHRFHRPCILPWLNLKLSCPTCRAPVPRHII